MNEWERYNGPWEERFNSIKRSTSRDNSVNPGFQRQEYVLSRLKKMAEEMLPLSYHLATYGKKWVSYITQRWNLRKITGLLQNSYLETKMLDTSFDWVQHAIYQLVDKLQVNIGSGEYSKSRKQFSNAFNEDLEVENNTGVLRGLYLETGTAL